MDNNLLKYLDDIRSFHGPSAEGMQGGHHIDLFKANAWLLEQTGVLPDNIRTSGIDTYTDTSFYSARREGVGTGRIVTAVRLKLNA